MHDDLKLETRDKVFKKMSRDGAVEVNASKGTSKHISGRIIEQSLDKVSSDEPVFGRGAKAINSANPARRNKRAIYGKSANTKASGQKVDGSKSERLNFDDISVSDKAGIVGNQAGKLKSKNRLQHKSRLMESAEDGLHQKIREEEDDNLGVEAAHNSEFALEKTIKASNERIRRTSNRSEERGSGGNASNSIDKSNTSGETSEAAKSSKLKFDDESGPRASSAPTEESAASKSVAGKYNHSKPSSSKLHEKGRAAVFEEKPKAGTVTEGHISKTGAASAEQQSKGKQIQKNQIKKSYAAAFRDGKKASGSTASSAVSNVGSKVTDAAKAVGNKTKDALAGIVRNHAGVIAALLAVLIIGIMLVNSLGVMGSLLAESGQAFTESTYLSSDDDILQGDNQYISYEEELQKQIDNIESDYPGYDEYRYQVDEISHDSYALTSYLTAMYGNYKYADIADDLLELFHEQYTLTLNRKVEIRTRTVIDDEGNEYEEEYEWYVLEVTLTNKGMDAIAQEHLNEQQLSLYNIYQASLGNRSYLFGDSITAGNPASGGMSYDIPPEALEDEAFARMIQEAEKYLGRAYVWGGSNPTTGFDCSGFVSWVINHSGNGWNVGRSTANGLRSYCTYASPSEAKPGDLIFFQKTYNTTGASHVGIYVGNGMMIHCGNPIQYTSINSNYWQEHFLSFGRLR